MNNTFDLLCRIVAETRCKPNWSFRIVDEDGALRLVIRVESVDNFDHDRPFTVDHYHPVPITTYNEKTWRRWIFDRCVGVEIHEVGENLRFGDGAHECRPFLPTHGPGEDPYVVREYRHEDDAFTKQDGSLRTGPGPSGVRSDPGAAAGGT